MLTSKQRARMAALASKMNPLVHLGKLGAADGLYAALDKALADHELVKLRFVDFKGTRKELALALAEKTGSELIRVIGNVGIFFRRNKDPEKQLIKLD